ncbi:helix-turn-helix domain-containing protein [Sphingomonas faeni]|uniref:helix-turn-helix domain-containing protein n=1 Tax=Sphingomonas faeni TaxID=185950 RepID=UPI003344EAD8
MPRTQTKTETSTDPLSQAFGRRVSELRTHEPMMTPQILAERLGVSVQYLWRIETGRQNVSLRTAARIATAFEITLAELFENVEMPEVALENRPYTKVADDAGTAPPSA